MKRGGVRVDAIALRMPSEINGSLDLSSRTTLYENRLEHSQRSSIVLSSV